MGRTILSVLCIILTIMLALALLCCTPTVPTPEIHCKHFFHGYPTGTPASNDLIIRDIYAMSTNDETKFADWVAYRINLKTVSGDANTSRRWKADPWLDESETLEPPDYKKAPATLGIDRGHQAPAGFVQRHAILGRNQLPFEYHTSARGIESGPVEESGREGTPTGQIWPNRLRDQPDRYSSRMR